MIPPGMAKHEPPSLIAPAGGCGAESIEAAPTETRRRPSCYSAAPSVNFSFNIGVERWCHTG